MSRFFRHDWKCVHLDNVGLKMCGAFPPLKMGAIVFFFNLAAISPISLGWSAWNFAQWLTALKVGFKNFGAFWKMWGGSKNSKIGTQFCVLGRITLGPVGITSPKLLHMVCHEAGWKLGYKFFGNCTLKICGRTTWCNFGQLWKLYTSIANISERIKQSTSGKWRYQLQSLPSLTNKIWWTLAN